jgi:hypothetical protein
MNVSKRDLSLWLTVIGSVVTAIGVWFWYNEKSYAAENNSDLAATLQWVGVAQALTGIALILIARIMKDK